MVSGWWRVSALGSAFLFVIGLVFLIEPRGPSQWFATLGSMEHAAWTSGLPEMRMRMRRWWRWRKKYASRTKLNV